MRTKSKLRILGGLIVGFTAGVAAYWIIGNYPAQDVPDFWGEPVAVVAAVADQPAAVNLNIQSGCRIRRFGMHPWAPPGKARTEEWALATHAVLIKTGWSEADATEGVRRMKAGNSDEVFAMGNKGGVTMTSGEYFKPVFQTTFTKDGKRYLCEDSRTMFVNNAQMEYGKLYRINGRIIGEFIRCGNTAVLYPGPAAGVGPANGVGDGDDGADSDKNGGGAVAKKNEVGEPGTLFLMSIAFGAAILVRKRK